MLKSFRHTRTTRGGFGVCLSSFHELKVLFTNPDTRKNTISRNLFREGIEILCFCKKVETRRHHEYKKYQNTPNTVARETSRRQQCTRTFPEKKHSTTRTVPEKKHSTRSISQESDRIRNENLRNRHNHNAPAWRADPRPDPRPPKKPHHPLPLSEPRSPAATRTGPSLATHRRGTDILSGLREYDILCWVDFCGGDWGSFWDDGGVACASETRSRFWIDGTNAPARVANFPNSSERRAMA